MKRRFGKAWAAWSPESRRPGGPAMRTVPGLHAADSQKPLHGQQAACFGGGVLACARWLRVGAWNREVLAPGPSPLASTAAVCTARALVTVHAHGTPHSGRHTSLRLAPEQVTRHHDANSNNLVNRRLMLLRVLSLVLLLGQAPGRCWSAAAAAAPGQARGPAVVYPSTSFLPATVTTNAIGASSIVAVDANGDGTTDLGKLFSCCGGVVEPRLRAAAC
jgi:hypothetical protein